MKAEVSHSVNDIWSLWCWIHLFSTSQVAHSFLPLPYNIVTLTCWTWFISLRASHTLDRTDLYYLHLSLDRWWGWVCDLLLLCDFRHSSCELQLTASSYGWSESWGWRALNRWTELSLRRRHLTWGVVFDLITNLELPLVVTMWLCVFQMSQQLFSQQHLSFIQQNHYS